ncbi:MAG: hypothetical protein PHO00_06535 [bacterium]|nr:hypothetical protein [bacterium]
MKKIIAVVILTFLLFVPSFSYAKTKSPDDCFRDYLSALKLNKEKTVEKYTYDDPNEIEKQKLTCAKMMKEQGMDTEAIKKELQNIENWYNSRKNQKIQSDAIWASCDLIELIKETEESGNKVLEYVAKAGELARSMFNNSDKIYLRIEMKKVGNIWKVVSILGSPLDDYIRWKKEQMEQRKEAEK